LNTSILASRDIDIFANVGLSYLTGKLQEQGMSRETNPLLAASLAMPVLSPYKKESNGNLLNRYAAYDEWNVNANPTFAYDNVSNPLAIVNTVMATDKIYDANIRFGINYRTSRYLTLTALLNILINYTEESIFIPGVTDKAILPQYYGVGYNTVRRGVLQSRSDYYGFNAAYNRAFNKVHQLKANAGVRYVGRSQEFDGAQGYNTSNDYYKTLNQVTEDKRITGANLEWKWLNYYFYGDYTYNNILKADLNIAVDGSSVSGVDAPRFGIFPSLGLTAMLANMSFLPDEISALNVFAVANRTGNSRFSSNYAKNYYLSSNLFNLGTIVKTNVPNTRLEWEKTDKLEAGLDLALFKNLIYLNAKYYAAKSFDLLVARNISSVYGSSDYYDNTGIIATNGFEVALTVNLVRTRDFGWTVSGTLATAKSKIAELGNSNELFIDFKQYNGDDVMLVMRKGEEPYQFYGYRTNGVYATTEEANAAGLNNIYGKPYRAGDVRFVNENSEDNVINAKDKVLLGTAAPDFFGNVSTNLRYKKFSLTVDFGYSIGNVAYNAVRRELESMSGFYNQSRSVLNRWQVEGDNAALPRAEYGDPAGNNAFSDRWLEDASYLKLRNLTLQYSFGNFMNIFQSGFVYVSAQNLVTFTKYLGGDPEFSYSYLSEMQGFDYAKVSIPRTVQIGFQLNF
ncbi:MAG: TonB-dependent receptor, partial [Paludibacter sp.]|nr:TonB-dependent receptor [Paludibacter sp.]